MQRYSRQLLLSEIGEQGQKKINGSPLLVQQDADASTLHMARVYGRAAGLRIEGSRTQSRALFPQALDLFFRHHESRAVGLGAASALASALSALDSLPQAPPFDRKS